MADARSHRGGDVKRRWKLALAASVALLGVSDIAKCEVWKPVKVEPPTSQSDHGSDGDHWIKVEAPLPTRSPQIQWQELTAEPNRALPKPVVWIPVEPSIATDIDKKIEEETPIEDPFNAAVAIQLP